MAVREYHVESNGKGGWQLRRGDAEEPFAFYKSKAAAESAARVVAHQNEALVVVHDEDGATRRTDYHGNPVTA